MTSDPILTQAEIVSQSPLAEGFFDLRLLARDIVSAASPGQFVMIQVDGKPLRRPISICEADENSSILRLVFEVRGEGTLWLSRCKPGAVLSVLGPLGRGFRFGRAKHVAVVGGGIGIPPLLGTVSAFTGNKSAVLGYRAADAAILQHEFAKVCGKVFLTTNDGSLGEQGVVTTPLERLLCGDGPPDLICACGPEPMLRAICDLSAKYAVKTQVSLEQRMACGVGACLVCSCKVNLGSGETYGQVCRNGPVFDAKEVIWS